MKKPSYSNKSAPLRLASANLWLAADIHLGPQLTHTAAAFYVFLRHASRHAGGLILAGDIFDAWIGDDQALCDPPPWLAAALRELAAFGAQKPLWLLHGNRDFLMRAALAARCNAQILRGEILLELGTAPADKILLAHGDEYCTDDLGYQRLRAVVRRPWVQWLFLRLPLAWRRRIAARARASSGQAQRHKSAAIMDVNQQALEAALRACAARTLIHGHTHRPAQHSFLLDGAPAQRYVLPDWDCEDPEHPRGGWLQLSPARISRHHISSIWPPQEQPRARDFYCS